jgi:hypothetical protein
MRTISYRIDDERAKKLDSLFAQYEFTAETASANHMALFDMLFEIAQNNKNSQTISETLARHKENEKTERCPLQIETTQIIRVLGADDKPAYENQKVLYCIQWEKGKVKRQLKLITSDVCAICKALKEKWLEETPEIIPDDSPRAEQPRQILATIPNSRPEPPQLTPAQVMNSWNCEKAGCIVHYSVCADCKAKNANAYYGCLRLNPEIAKALAYWNSQTLKR